MKNEERSIYARDIDLGMYLPPFLTEYREIGALLKAESTEFSALLDALKRLLDDLFIETASPEVIGRYERIMGARPAAGDSLKTRRLRLLLAAGRVERFTLARLVETAAKLGEVVEAQLLDGFRIALDFIAADPENIALLLEEFQASLPAHLEIIVRNVTSAGGGDFVGGALGLSMVYTFEGVE